MLELLGRLFRRAHPALISFEHAMLGRLKFDSGSSTWETTADAPIYHGGMPGDTAGPYPDGVAEVLRRLDNVEKYWQACSDDLLYIASGYASLPRVQDPRTRSSAQFTLSPIGEHEV